MNINQYLTVQQQVILHVNISDKGYEYSCFIKKIKNDLIAVVLPEELKDSPACKTGINITLKWTKDNKPYSLSTKFLQDKAFPLVILKQDGEIVELESIKSEDHEEISDGQSGEGHSEKASVDTAALDHLRDLVNDVPQLFSLGPEEVNKLLHYVSYKLAKKGSPLFKEGESGDSMFYIANGVIDIIKESIEGNPIKLAQFARDNMLGEMSLVDTSPRSATAIVTEDAELIILTRESFDNLLKNIPSIGIKIFKQIAGTLSQRVRFANGRLVDVLDQANQQGVVLEEKE